jgi:HEAT repeat protein
MVRARALEAVSRFMLDKHGMLLVSALDDPAPGVRTVAATAIGDMRYTPGLQRLNQMVSTNQEVGEQYYTVLPAVVYALYRMGDDRHLKLLGPLLLKDAQIIRTSAATAIGMIGDPRGLVPLKETVWREEYDARLRFDEAMARLGDPAAQGRLEAYLHGRYVDLRIGGIQALAEHNPDRAAKLLPVLATQEGEHPAVRLAAIGELAKLRMAHPSMYQYGVRGMNAPGELLREAFDVEPDKSVDRELRQFVQMQAIWALGWFHAHPETVDSLLKFLDVEDPSTRVLAAMSIMRLLPEVTEAQPPSAPLPKTSVEVEEGPDSIEDPLAPVVPDVPGGRLKSSGAKD